jgi:hypothetical protein
MSKRVRKNLLTLALFVAILVAAIQLLRFAVGEVGGSIRNILTSHVDGTFSFDSVDMSPSLRLFEKSPRAAILMLCATMPNAVIVWTAVLVVVGGVIALLQRSTVHRFVILGLILVFLIVARSWVVWALTSHSSIVLKADDIR